MMEAEQSPYQSLASLVDYFNKGEDVERVALQRLFLGLLQESVGNRASIAELMVLSTCRDEVIARALVPYRLILCNEESLEHGDLSLKNTYAGFVAINQVLDTFKCMELPNEFPSVARVKCEVGCFRNKANKEKIDSV